MKKTCLECQKSFIGKESDKTERLCRACRNELKRRRAHIDTLGIDVVELSDINPKQIMEKIRKKEKKDNGFLFGKGPSNFTHRH